MYFLFIIFLYSSSFMLINNDIIDVIDHISRSLAEELNNLKKKSFSIEGG